MLFNSLNFAIFLPIVFFLYWFVTKGNLRAQNLVLLLSSYLFYACWDYRFLGLLFFSTLLDYLTGIKIGQVKSQSLKKTWLCLSICINLAFLGVFKYYNFFVTSFGDSLSQLGIKSNFTLLQVILPVGISFYTFHGISYVIDVYKRRIKPETNIVNYSLFVSFFPLLVAGPIERATHLLPQIVKARRFDYSKTVDGLRQILWGLFKKIAIADQLAGHVNTIFNNSSDLSGSTLVVGALFFTIQIYCDFSGYSDIALGTARLFGIELLRNFAFPYFSRDIAEFWRRWHISLSSWFRDYLYIPLGGSRGGIRLKMRNVFITFLVSSLWHGGNWTFIAWGMLNALYIMPSIILNTNRENLDIVAKGKYLPTLKEFLSMTVTFGLTTLAWIFFRANDIKHALSYIGSIFSETLFVRPNFTGIGNSVPIVFLTCIFLIIEWLGREQEYAIAELGLKWYRPLRWAMYYAIILTIFYFGDQEQEFIYFQF